MRYWHLTSTNVTRKPIIFPTDQTSFEEDDENLKLNKTIAES